MNIPDLMRALTATPKRTEKLALLTQAYDAGLTDFFTGAKLALDPLMPFWVRSVAEIELDEDAAPESEGLSFEAFTRLADRLHRREVTGHAARDAIHAAAAVADPAMWNLFYRRVLLKDLKCGVQAATINEVLGKIVKGDPRASAYMIPPFPCQLAENGETPQHAKKLRGRKLLDLKLDGVRLLSVLNTATGTVTQYTRDGRVNENFAAIRADLEALLPHLTESVVLDGEVVAGSFQELMTQINRQSNVSTDDARLAVFDFIPYADFEAGRSPMPQTERHAVLVDLVMRGLLDGGRVFVLPKLEVDLDTEMGQTATVQFNRDAIAAGYEGIMFKSPDAPYEGRRTVAWLKKKPFMEVSLTVTGIQDGERGSKYDGLVGAFICEGEEDGRTIVVEVGSGLTDKDRQDRDVIGRIAEVRADGYIRERGSETWSLRFPRFKGWRGGAPGVKL